ncbi:strawberry notch-like NTP hydrolase domain-containing protein [Chlorogloea sp. CCALA 695]|uniref:strawberry notch-like NTP hydrolase domain-containing protein n=1 Tax=Chlorogloea sp. CCALA 695 TaxID=2107693 RepID=UPI0018EC8F0E|nr:strawberry notch family protein [Chlorogloea sp. CCALA 695]
MLQLNLFDVPSRTISNNTKQLILKLDPVLPKAKLITSVGLAISQLIVQGQQISPQKLSQIMTAAFGGTDAEGNWQWKEAYEAMEVGLIIYLRQYARNFLQESPKFVLQHLLGIQALLPTQTKRSLDQISLQQFSTPISLAYCVARAAQIRAEDVVLEPSAGTGLLAVWAELAGAKLILNELHQVRRELLVELFPGIKASKHNAEQINDLLERNLSPSVVIMNPPFSASPNSDRRNPFATLKHVKSALMRLCPGGRLVAITANWFSPTNHHWQDLFTNHLEKYGTVEFSCGIEGSAWHKHGVGIETRITVIDRIPNNGRQIIIDECLELPQLLEEISKLPPRSVKVAKQILAPAKVISATPNTLDRAVQLTFAKTTAVVAPELIPANSGEIIDLEYEVVDWDRNTLSLSSGIYEAYEPQTIRVLGASSHITPLVQSAAMASVAPPKPTYRPKLPQRLITEGILSDAQLESIIYAGNAHEQFLSSWYKVDESLDRVERSAEGEPGAVQFRQGYFIGDGTGVGKGRQCCGILLDQWLRGEKKAVWFSKSSKLLEDARRDWCALGGSEHDLIPLSKFNQGEAINLTQGIIFSTYATLRTEAKQSKISRVEQLVNWLGNNFDGLVIFDESHAMANALTEKGGRGDTKASMQGISGLRLQRALPQARVLYLSATGATALANLGYLDRLGLWGGGDTSFKNREDFISSVATGGVAALEVVARDLKALGLYTARSLSYDGVEYEVLEHQLSEAQVDIYDRYAEAYQIIHANIEAAMEATNIVSPVGKTRNSNAKSAAYSAFESTKQRFFNHLLISMKCPTLIKSVEKDLEAGHAIVIQLVSTDEALLDRRLAEIPASQHNDIQVDVTPREYLFDYLMKAFPVLLHRVWTDGEGVEHSEPAKDIDGNPVFCVEAIAQRDELIESLALLPPIPSALDQIVQHFGYEQVAECTGRSKRIVREITSNSDKLVVQKRSTNANLAEAQAFQNDQKQILIFSQAGGTGRSYHADKSAKNQRLRKHYLLESGWRADEAVQGLGRTNRSNQKQPPVFVVVSTDVKGEKRFTSTISRRLDSLGALTKGQRQTGGQGLFKEEDNLESDYAKASLRQLYAAIYRGQIEGFSLGKFLAVTGLKLVTEEGTLKEDLPPITQFLNRCLAMPIADQKRLFEELEVRIESRIEQAISAGVYEVGVETLRSEGFRVLERTVIYQHPRTEALSHAVKIEQKQRTKITLVNTAIEKARLYNGQLCINEKSGGVAVVTATSTLIGDDGENISRVNLLRPLGNSKLTMQDFHDSTWRNLSMDKFTSAWNQELQDLPEFTYSNFYLVTGLLLPIWKKLDTTLMRVYRLQTDDGEQLLGRVLNTASMSKLASQFGIKCSMSDREIYQSLIEHKQKVNLTENLTLVNSLVAGEHRIEIIGFQGKSELDFLKSLGAFGEIIQWKARAFIPTKAEVALEVIKKIRAIH